MAPAPSAPAPTWRAVSRERHVAAPRDEAWAALAGRPFSDRPEHDLSVEPPWRLVRTVAAEGVERCEVVVAIRDDGGQCHLAWGAGATTAGADEATVEALLADLADRGAALLAEVATTAEGEQA